jgi:hypothetical protein
MTLMRGRLAAVEDEWHIRGIPEWIDPVFTFQRTWYPDDVPPSVSFNSNLARAFAFIGGGLLGYYVWNRTRKPVYTGLAGAAGFVGAPLLVAAYDRFQQPEEGEVVESTETDMPSPEVQNTITQTQMTPTLVPGSPQIKRTELAPTYRPGVIYRPPADPNALI